MEIIVKPLQKRYEHINIHHGELKVIYDLMFDKTGSVKLTTEKYKFDDWDEFIANTKNLNQISMTSFSNQPKIHCRFEVKDNTCEWDCSWGNYEGSASLYNSVDSILSAIEIKNPWIFSFPVLGFFTTLLFASFLIKYFVKIVPEDLVNILVWFSVCYHVLYLTLIKTKNKISISHAEDKKNFWKRNRDTIIVNLSVAIIAAILSVALTYYFLK